MKKKALSLLLACTMAFSSFSMALAAGDAVVVEATQSNEQMAGDFLKAAGVLKGDDKGNLNLDQALTREQAMLMIAKLMGKEDEALNFKGQSTFKDAKNNAYWAPVIAWAEAQKLTNGMGDGTFGLGKEATKNQVVTMYLRVLGYEVTWAGKELSADSQKVVEETGLLTAVGETFNRGAMAVMTVNTLKATPKGAETTLAKNLNVDMTKAPKFVTPSKPGEIGDAKVESAKAIANDKIEVKFDKEVSPAAADFKVTEKADAAKAIEVKELTAESTKVVVLTVEGLTSGKGYTVKVGENTVNFTAIAKSTIAATVEKVEGTDFNRVKVSFKAPVDKATAETVANYTIEKATVVKATLSSDRKSVTLETEGLVKNTLYKITVENVKSVDMVSMKKYPGSFRAIEDTTKPTVLGTPNYRNNETITVQFSKSMDKTTLENLENYKITSSAGQLEITSIKVSETAKENDTVTIKTATQDVKATYTFVMDGLTDASVKKNPLTKVTRTFRGIAADTTSPVVVGNPKAVSNNLVEVKFFETNLLDKASVEDVNNYAFDRDLQVVSVKLDEDTNKYGTNEKVVLITTSTQEKGNYKITVKGVMDQFGNALKPLSGTNYRQYGFQYGEQIVAAPTVKSIVSNGQNTVLVTFNEDVNKTTAQDPTNYVVSDLGAATKAELKGQVVTLTTATQTVGKTYTLTINGVEHKYAAIPMADVKGKFVAKAVEADLTAPTLSYVYAPNKNEVHVAFSEPMAAPTTTIGALKVVGPANLDYVDSIGDGEILVFKHTAGLSDGDFVLTNGAVTLTDKAGNAFVLNNGETFRGTSLANQGPVTTVSDMEQKDVKTIKVTFDKNVVFTGDLTVSGKESGSTTAKSYTFKPEYGDTKNVVLFRATSAIKPSTELSFNFKTLTDKVGGAAKDETLTFTTYMTAEDAPVLTNATAINNKKVELNFTEGLSFKGAYVIKYYDEKGEYKVFENVSASNTGHDTNSDKVTLTLTQTLKGDQTYYIEYLSAAVNLNNKYAVTKDFKISFQGTDTKASSAYLSGVSFIGTQTVVVYDNAGNKVTPASIQVVSGTGIDTLVTTGALATGTKLGVNPGHGSDFLASKTYKVAVDGFNTLEFSGVLQDAQYADAITSVQLLAGATSPAAVTGGSLDIIQPNASVTNSNNSAISPSAINNINIKFVVESSNGTTTTITKNGSAYTSGDDLAVATGDTVTFVITTKQDGRADAVRTYIFNVQ